MSGLSRYTEKERCQMELQMLFLTFYSSVTIAVVVLAPFYWIIYIYHFFLRLSVGQHARLKHYLLFCGLLLSPDSFSVQLDVDDILQKYHISFKKWQLKKCVFKKYPGTCGRGLRFSLV